MPSGAVSLKKFALLLKRLMAFRIAGFLGSIPAGNGALVYLFIMLSNLASFRQRNILSTEWP